MPEFTKLKKSARNGSLEIAMYWQINIAAQSNAMGIFQNISTGFQREAVFYRKSPFFFRFFFNKVLFIFWHRWAQLTPNQEPMSRSMQLHYIPVTAFT